MLWWKVALVLVWSGALCSAGHGRRPAPASGRAHVAPAAAELTAQYWVDEAHAAIAQRRRQRAPTTERARNVIMFLGDGMSVPTLAAARTLLGQRASRPGEEGSLAFEDFPTLGLAKTYCVDHQIADSACTATAYLCGVKTNDGMLGLTAAVPRRDCDSSLEPAARLRSIAEWAIADGKVAGIVTTTRVTHASPAGAYAHSADRYWENDAAVNEDGYNATKCRDIAHQLIHEMPGKEFKVILGGGRREFLPNTTYDEEGSKGYRWDNRNLIQEWEENKRDSNLSYAYIWNRDQLMQLFESPPEYLLGLFESSNMQYHLQADATMEPTLAEMTEVAIRSLSRNEKGFFLFVEGGRIDHAHHDNLVHLALDETIELSAAVARAVALLPADDTLLVVTADHGHVMTFNGYTRRGGDILGPSDDLGDDGVPYMTLSYANGPGARPHVDGKRVNVLKDDKYGDSDWRTHAEVPLQWETHGGEDVVVFARGPQHEMFAGLYEQSQLPHLMAHIACFGPEGPARPHCSAAAAGPRALWPAAFALGLLLRSWRPAF